MSNIKLIFGEAIEEMSKLEDDSIDMILTDPPYGTTACKWDSTIPFDDMWEQLNRVIKPNGAIVLFGGQPFASNLVVSNLKNFHCEWVWHKSKPSGIAFKTQPMRNHENIYVFGKIKTFNGIKEPRVGFTEASKKRFESGKNLGSYRSHGNSTTGMGGTALKKIERLRKPTTIRKVASVPNRLGTLHPTQKPVPLMEYLIRTYTNEGETILDFSCGSGSTLMGCQNTNRNGIGIDNGYCEKDKTINEIQINGLKWTEISRLRVDGKI